MEYGFRPIISRMRQLGKIIYYRIQPIAVTFVDVSDAAYLLEHVKQLCESVDDIVSRTVFFNRDMTKAEAQAAYELRIQLPQRKSTWSRSNGDQSSANDGRWNNRHHHLAIQPSLHRLQDRSDVQPSDVLTRPLTPPIYRGSTSNESLPLSSSYNGSVQPSVGLHLPTRDGCSTLTSVHYLPSSTQFGFVQPRVSAIASVTAGTVAQRSSVANYAVVASQTT